MDTVAHSLNSSLSDQPAGASSFSSQEYQRLLNERTILNIFGSIIIFFGFCGNIVTVTFYVRQTKKTPTANMIKLLAMVDLAVCLLAIISGPAVNILFKYASMCKTMNFLFHWFIGTSVGILCTIAIDRYRKICEPHGRQFTNRTANRTIVVMSAIIMILSTHDFVTHVVKKTNTIFNNANITRFHCVNTDDEHLKAVVKIFHGLDAFITIVAILLFVIMYGTICYTLHKHNKTIFSSIGNSRSVELNNCGAESECRVSLDIASEVSNKKSNMPRITPEQSDERSQNDFNNPTTSTRTPNHRENEDKCTMFSVPMQNLPSVESTININNVTTPAPRLSKTIKAERQLTSMVLAITVAFCVCFSPYLVVAFFIPPEMESKPWVYFALTSPAWHSVVNPFIFCIFNAKYRQYVKDIFTRCFSLITCKCKNSC